MHPNPSFRKTKHSHALDFAKNRGFGVLSINGQEGPISAHVPFTLADGDTQLRAHLVASNPVYRALSEGPTKALVSISGPDSYISPDWYGAADQVPTWNYVAVNIRGSLKMEDPARLLDFLNELSHHFESRLAPKPIWRTDKVQPQILAKMMRQIRPVSIDIEQIESTFKLGQNKPEQARVSAATQVHDHGIGHEIASLSKLMHEAGE